MKTTPCQANDSESAKQLTPIEWFYEQINGMFYIHESIYEQAKEKEKQRIVKTYDIAVHDTLNFDIDRNSSLYFAEKHFKETFK
jgi:hypothetical protein